MSDIKKKLHKFARENGVHTKGPFSVVLVVTRMAKKKGLPLDPNNLLSARGGQVAGLGKGAVQAILKDYGISRILAKEGGRTSRGSIDLMRAYVAFLNDLDRQGLADLDAIESIWIALVKEYFSRSPFKLRLDPSKSFRAIVADLIAQALERQKEMPGTMFAGAVLQHLVGAKLNVLLPTEVLLHHGFAVADGPTERQGDFRIEDVVIHVTTAPTEMLIRTCADNLGAGLRPIIVTTNQGAGGAEALAATAGIDGRIDVFEIEQFVAANVYELSRFAPSARRVTVEQLVENYNTIVENCETDQSLRIEIG
ncbi:MAG: DUF4928 family protein [Desulfuromonadales bacterium]